MFSTSAYKITHNFVQSIGFTSINAVGKVETLAERIKQIAAYYNLSISEMCRRIDVAPATMHGYLNENREPKLSFFQNFINAFPDVDINWLISGNGNIIRDNEYLINLEKQLNIVEDQLQVYKKLDRAMEEIEDLRKRKKWCKLC